MQGMCVVGFESHLSIDVQIAGNAGFA